MTRFVTFALLFTSLSTLAAAVACSKDEETQPARQRDGGGASDSAADANTVPAPRDTPEPTWVKTFGGPGTDTAVSIAIATDGTIAITGSYEGGALPFGPVTIAPATPSARDGFIGFLDDKGEAVRGYGFTNGNVFVARGRDQELVAAGSFASTTQIGDKTLTSNGERDAFAAWFGEKGRFDRATSYGSTADDDVKFAQPLPGDGRVMFVGEGQFALGDGGVSEPGAARSIFALEVDRGGNAEWLATSPLGATVASCGVGKDGIGALLAAAKAGDDMGDGPLIVGPSTPQGAPAFIRYSKQGARERTSLLANDEGQKPKIGNVLFGEAGEMYFGIAQQGSLQVDGKSVPGSGGVTLVRVDGVGGVKWTARYGGPHVPASPRVVRDDTGDFFVLTALDSAKAAVLYRIAADTGAIRAASQFKLPPAVTDVIDVAPALDGSWIMIANGTGANGSQDIVVARYASL